MFVSDLYCDCDTIEPKKIEESVMRDLIVTARGGGRSHRIKPGGGFVLEVKSYGSEISQGGISMRSKGFEETFTFNYDDLLTYVGTTSGIVRVKYAD
jgi:hypothetical protein